MADGLVMRLTPESQANFQRVMHEFQRETGKDADKISRNMARDFCRAAVSISWSYRATSTDPKYWRQKDRNGNIVIVPWHKKGGGIREFDGDGGMMATGWSGCLTRLGVRGRRIEEVDVFGKIATKTVDAGHGGKRAKMYSAVTVVTDAHSARYTVANTTPWIVDWENGKNPKDRKINLIERSAIKVIRKSDSVLKKLAHKRAKQYGFA